MISRTELSLGFGFTIPKRAKNRLRSGQRGIGSPSSRASKSRTALDWIGAMVRSSKNRTRRSLVASIIQSISKWLYIPNTRRRYFWTTGAFSRAPTIRFERSTSMTSNSRATRTSFQFKKQLCRAKTAFSAWAKGASPCITKDINRSRTVHSAGGGPTSKRSRRAFERKERKRVVFAAAD